MKDPPPSIKLRLTAKDHGLEAEGNGRFGIIAIVLVLFVFIFVGLFALWLQ
ncbi:hypothetical protein L0V05_13955 [Tabrizicola sp. J26]|uniref:hypothetical protein n=1 Tax=Alitabrizicola rongguiensis TaxID=2909234 RepID=UPI001F424CAC|nr:hypothetical protein [Tabrizicola rongguiensis]MCF1709919.1 hypothetical protein [Tabrizicola rongguiensis]